MNSIHKHNFLNHNIQGLLKKLILKYKLQALLKKPLPTGSNNSRVIILIDVDTFNEESVLKNYNNVFQDYVKNTDVVKFTLQKKKIKENPDALISTRAISLTGEFNNKVLKKVISQEYEYVFQFFDQNHLYLNYLLAKTKASLRIGFENNHQQLTDLSIKSNKEDLALFFNEAKKYLQIIKK